MAALWAKLAQLLAGPLGWLAQMILQFGLQKIMDYFAQMKRDSDAANAAKKQAAADMQNAKDLKPDSSKKEQEDAANDAFKHF